MACVLLVCLLGMLPGVNLDTRLIGAVSNLLICRINAALNQVQHNTDASACSFFSCQLWWCSENTETHTVLGANLGSNKAMNTSSKLFWPVTNIRHEVTVFFVV